MTDVWGGGVVIAVTAVLWLAYLTPTWYHRHEYAAAQRAAVRLQRTLHVMAETTQVPDEIRVVATARQAVRQAKVLRKTRRIEEARLRAEERVVLAKSRDRLEEARSRARKAAAAPRTLLVRRRRRGRLAASCSLLAGLAGLLAALFVPAASAAGLGVAAGIVAGLGLAVLALLARPVRPRVAPARAVSGRAIRTDAAAEVVGDTARRTWTPVPLPRPLHLEPGTRAAAAMASVEAQEIWQRETQRAALEQEVVEQRLRDGLRPAARRPAPLRSSVVFQEERSQAVPPSGAGEMSAARQRRGIAAHDYARMGRVGDAHHSAIDLDTALRRRRAV